MGRISRIARQLGASIEEEQRKLLSIGRYPKSEGQHIHRQRAERALGRPLPSTVHVHHADGSRAPDAPLVICQDAEYHWLLHLRAKVYYAGGNPNTQRWCSRCQQCRDFNLFPLVRSRGKQRRASNCQPCLNAKQATYYGQNRSAINQRKRDARRRDQAAPHG